MIPQYPDMVRRLPFYPIPIAPLAGGDPFMGFIPQQQPQPVTQFLPLQSLIQHGAPFAPPGLQQMFPTPTTTTTPTTPAIAPLQFPAVIQQLAPFAPPGLQQATGQPTAPVQPMPGHNPGHHYGNPGYYGSYPYCGCPW